MFEEREKSSTRRIILLAFLIFIIIIVVTTYIFYENPPENKSSVTLKVSLNPSTIKANSKVTIYSGNNPLIDNKYSFVLDASDPSEERIFNVDALLEEWVSGSEYTIFVNLYVDGDEIGEESQKLTLSVKE
jgi:hypothetical protein